MVETGRTVAKGSPVRDSFVDATIRAINASGQRVSMDEIAHEAGSSKPRLYRYFEDRDDLYQAVAQRIIDEVFRRARPDFNLLVTTPREALGEAIGCYASVVAEQPSVFRFVRDSQRVSSQSNMSRDLSARITPVVQKIADAAQRPVTGIDLVVHVAIGALLAATDQWLDITDGADRRPERFAAQCATPTWGLIAAYFDMQGIAIPGDQPLYVSLADLHTSARETAG